MTVAIDKLGRIVVPKQIRDRYHLYPGAVLELEAQAEGIKLCMATPKGSLVNKQGVLVHHGTSVVDIDIVDFIQREREPKYEDFVAENPRS
jgi:AbrB family looped-hinge helix DNA binding protein